MRPPLCPSTTVSPITPSNSVWDVSLPPNHCPCSCTRLSPQSNVHANACHLFLSACTGAPWICIGLCHACSWAGRAPFPEQHRSAHSWNNSQHLPLLFLPVVWLLRDTSVRLDRPHTDLTRRLGPPEPPEPPQLQCTPLVMAHADTWSPALLLCTSVLHRLLSPPIMRHESSCHWAARTEQNGHVLAHKPLVMKPVLTHVHPSPEPDNSPPGASGCGVLVIQKPMALRTAETHCQALPPSLPPSLPTSLPRTAILPRCVEVRVWSV